MWAAIKALIPVLGLLANLLTSWPRSQEQQRRQKEDEAIHNDPSAAFDSHFGGVSLPNNADASDKAGDKGNPPSV